MPPAAPAVMPQGFTSDPTEPVSRNATPPVQKASRSNAKRRQTLLSLLDALNELTGVNDLDDVAQMPSFESDRDVPTVDEHLQAAGAESFNKFQKRISNLDKELMNFSNAARQLASSVGILSSAFRLRERLAQILFLFRENAADLFPRKVPRQPRADALVNPTRRRKTRKPPPNVRRPIIDENLDPESFPEQLSSFAADVTTFLRCLNEFPEFTDEAVNASILTFEADLKYWSSCLQTYKTQFRYPAVQKYIHDIASEMGDHIDSITGNLSMFIDVGVPTIRFAQKHGATNLLNLSTVATFFSAVTATTLQFSYNLPHTDQVANAVNSFWFASLVFSIAAAVNSLLGLTWKQAMYRSPGHRVPWWVLIWIKRSPLVFLVLSVACFSIGLVLFSFASQQAFVTSTITTVLTAFTSFGLAAVSAWFATERWIFHRHRGTKWLGDVLTELNARFLDLPGMVLFRGVHRMSKKVARTTKSSLSRASTLTLNMLSGNGQTASPDENEQGNDVISINTLDMVSPTSPQHSSAHRPSFSLDAKASASPEGDKKDGNSDSKSGSPPLTAKARFSNAVRSVMTLQSTSGTSGPLSPLSPTRKRTASTNVTTTEHTRGRSFDNNVTAIPGSRVAYLVPRLQSLEPTQDLAAHSALVRHLQFSPNGNFLATSSWDRTSVIFRVGDPFISHRVLAHPQGFVSQVAWSPNGNMLLTKLNRAIKVWTEDGVCRKTIDRHRAVESITWFPGGEAFMSVEGSDVIKLDLNGKILDAYNFDRMKLHDVAVTPDSQRLLGVGPLLASPTGLQPSKCRAEKRLIVYNLDTKQVENQTPVLNDVRDITLAKNGSVALVSYENKAPPQLWKLELVKDRENNAISTGRLTLRHTYMPRVPVDFAGPSYFGGKNDQLVLCAGKAGDIHIWDRESAALLHHVRAQALGGDLTSIAWNHALDSPFMFATGSHDGAVRIWTAPHHDPRTRHGGGDTPSSFNIDMEYRRTESPVAQREDSEFTSPTLGMSASSDGDGDPLMMSMSRSVVFASPEAMRGFVSSPKL